MTDRAPESESQQPLYFLCYARSELDLVEKIEAKLAARRRRREIDVWRDLRNIDVWEQFSPRIHDALSRATGAIVVVSDSWYASDYIQTHEWPTILERRAHDESFAIFALAVTALDDDDPLRAQNFLNDLRRELLIDCSDSLRDTVLTRLSDQIGAHARSLPIHSSFAPSIAAPLPPAAAAVIPTSVANSSQGPSRPGLHNVPELPKEFVEPAELGDVCQRVMEGVVTGITGVYGEGGTGKTVLAAGVARRLVDEFPGGVHWVTVGEEATTEDVRRLQLDLLSRLLTEPSRPPRDHNEGKEMLRAHLVGYPALVIVDDVWHPWQGGAFDVVEQGGPGRLLVTTRFPEVLPARSASAEMKRLRVDEATAFLRTMPAGVPSSTADLAEVLDAAGGLRLALAVLSATALAQESWEPVLARLDGLATRFGGGDDASSAHKALYVALDTLKTEDRDRAWTLRAFPLDTPVPVSLLAELWQISLPDAREVVGRLAQRELVSATRDAVELHDHVHDFLALEASGRVLDVDLRLWEMARRRAAGAWGALADAEPYLWDRLVWHAVRAGLNSPTLRNLVSDLPWLSRRIRENGTAAAEQDIDRVCDRTGLDEGAPLRRLQRVLRHGGLFDAIGEDAGLELSLECWEDSLGIQRPGQRRLISGSLPVPGPALRRTLRGHTSAAVAVAFDPRGRRLATASDDGTARIWDCQTGDTLATLTGHSGELAGVTFDPQGHRIATTSHDGTARIWDSQTGEALATLSGHTGALFGVAFHPHGHRIATTGMDGTTRIWDPATGATLVTLTGHSGASVALAYAPDGRRIATASWDGTAQIWDAATGEVLDTLTGHTGGVHAVAFDPAGRLIATASDDGTARIWAAATGETMAILGSHTNGVFGVAFHPRGHRLATASWDGTVRIWDAATGTALGILAGHTSAVLDVAFDPRGHNIASAGWDGTARIWDSDTAASVAGESGHTSAVHAVAVDTSGRLLATTAMDGTARIWDAPTGEALMTLRGHSGSLFGVTFDPHGRRLATAAMDGTARVWDATTGETLVTLTGHTGAVHTVAFDPQSRRMATGGADGTARIWDSDTGETLVILTGHTSGVFGVAFDPQGRRLATGGEDGTARIWDSDTGETMVTLTGHDFGLFGVAFDPLGHRLATTAMDGTARIWDSNTGETLASLTGHSSGVFGVGFDPDGTRLATASADGTVRIWDPDRGHLELTLALACSGGLAWHEEFLAVAAGFHWALIELPASRR